MRRRRFMVAGAAAALGMAACEPDSEPRPTQATQQPTRSAAPTSAGRPSATPSPARTATPTPVPSPTGPREFDGNIAMRHVFALAREIGPREATSAAFGRASDYVEQHFRQAGLRVRRQELDVPAGDSWGVRVPSGRTFNVIAETPTFDKQRPHVVLGAHLDTVPQAPGAEDNASGVAVLLEVARLIGVLGAKTPAVLIAFGAEEPRGEGDAWHHYGSKAYVAAMSRRERSLCREMVSMDRVGVGPKPRIRHSGKTNQIGVDGEPVATWLASAAYEVGVDVAFEPSDTNRSSDHWSFHKGGVPAARIGGNPYPAYHSARDRPPVVEFEMLSATGKLVWEWFSDAPH